LKKIIAFIKKFQFQEKHAWIAFVGLAILAYGIYLGWLGFYWDDWPWLHKAIFNSHNSMLELDQRFRPFAGDVMWLGYLLAGKSAIGWQLFNIGNRLLATWAFWVLLKELWPNDANANLWASMLFVIYPIDQQYAAINTSRHLLPYGIFLFSLVFMVRAIKVPSEFKKWLSLSLLFSLIANLTTEYYYGLEFIRPFILFFALPAKTPWKEKIQKIAKTWLPLAMIIVSIFAWRYTISKSTNYDVSILDTISADPISGLISMFISIGGNIKVSIIDIWQLFLEPLSNWEIFITRYFYIIQLFSLFLTFIFLAKFQRNLFYKKNDYSRIVIGMLSLLTGSLSFLITDIPVRPNFPNSRALFPMMFGAILLIVGLLDWLITNRKIKIYIISIFFSLIIGIHFQISLSFYNEWITVNRFANQVSIRIPNIKPGTKIISKQLYSSDPSKFLDTGIVYSSDNSLSALINLIYNYDWNNPKEAIKLLYYRSQFDQGNYEIDTDENYLFIHFDGQSCLRIIDPNQDMDLFHIYLPVRELSIYTNLDSIDINTEPSAFIDPEIFTQQTNSEWCEYFERASLAVQRQNWEKIPPLWQITEEENLRPNRADELSPFITGFAHLGEYEQAYLLTVKAFHRNNNLDKFLCNLWQQVHLASNIPDNFQKSLKELFPNTICVFPITNN
jgi:hypothetical protein